MLSLCFLQLAYSLPTSRKILTFSGTISKYPIKMVLVIEKENVYGYYFYEKIKTKILLTGTMKGTKMILDESPSYEENTSDNREFDFHLGFKGELKDNKFLGYWIDNINGKKLTLNLKADTENYLNLIEQTSSIDGYYNNIRNSDRFSGSISLNYINENLFYFETYSTTESGCLGYLNGLININNFKSGIFSSEFCQKLNLNFNINTLEVREENCQEHGARCSFDGNFKKMLTK